MARDHARIDVHIWADEDWKILSAPAKLLYLQLLSQPRLTYAGLLDLSVKRWARAHPDTPLGEIRAALSELDNARFVVVDQDTEEVLVRTFIRNDGLYKQPQVLAAALRTAFDIESPILRSALAVELRRLPTDVTGHAPTVAAAALETGAREMTPAVKAALAARRTRHAPREAEPPGEAEPTVAPPAAPEEDHLLDEHADPARNPSVNPSGNPAVNPSGNPGGDPAGQAQGEGSRESGVVRLTLGLKKVGVPAPAPASARPRVGAHRRTREASEPQTTGHAPADDATRPGSTRQARRAEAERLVTTHSPPQPQDVLDRLRVQVIGMLAGGIEPAAIAAGLRIWASKKLSVSMLPELVGEHMRTHLATTATGAKLKDDLHTVAMFERVRASAIEQDDQSVIGHAVRGELPAHTTPAELDALLREAGQRALAAAVAAGGGS